MTGAARLGLTALTLTTVLALTGCQSGAADPRPLPAGPQVIQLELNDFSFTYDQSIQPGRVLFRLRNTGTVPHSMSVLPLSDDIPPIDEQLRGNIRRAITPVIAIRSRPPGASTTFALDLAPGSRYAFVCFRDDTDGTPHWMRGMSSEFRTTQAR